MYGMWILVIIFACILIIGIVLTIVGNNNDYVVMYVIGAISLIIVTALLIVSFLCAIILPIKAKQEYITFENTREIMQNAYENGTNLDNISITTSIIEANQWLAEVKANKQTYGIFSMYYYIDLNNIEPIILNKEV